ncbi:MAG: photosynthetic reaction center cytochrome c subunit family protein [Terriglobia bacterium]
MRTLLTVFLVAAGISAGVMVAQGPPGGKGGPKAPPKNLKILTPENYMDNMRAFVPALGLADKGGCNFCHEMDRSSDAKMEKVMARMMIGMVKEINGKFPDGKDHVSCYTCHRGDTMPKMAP